MKSKPYSRVYLEITNICNRSCSFCHGTSRPKRSLSLSEVDRISDMLLPFTDYIYLHLMGEPLTHKELPRIIELLSGKGFKCAITTNGTLLKERREELLSSGVYKINISLHSFESGNLCRHLDYVKECAKFASDASDKGILSVLRLWNIGGDDKENDEVLNTLRESIGGEWIKGSRGYRIKNKLHLEYGERFEWPDINIAPLGDSCFCYGLADHFGILSDGTVVPCCLDSDGVISLGNLFDTDLGEILASSRAVNIREGFKKRAAVEELCKRCGYSRRFG